VCGGQGLNNTTKNWLHGADSWFTQRRALLVGLPTLAVLVATLLLFSYARNVEQERIQLAFALQAESLAKALTKILIFIMKLFKASVTSMRQVCVLNVMSLWHLRNEFFSNTVLFKPWSGFRAYHNRIGQIMNRPLATTV